jgi:hypothetical protein
VQNDIVLISTGVIDNDGYALQADRFVFDLIQRMVADGLSFGPPHLDQVIVHHFHHR